MKDIPIEQIIRVERPSLTQKVRQLFEFVREVVEIPRVGRPVLQDRLEEGRWILEELAQWFVRKA
jgi:hypothetical protein